MTGVERIEQRASFIATDLAENDPVWTPAERRFEQIVETHGARMRIGLTLSGQQIPAIQAQFAGVLDHDNALVHGNVIRECIQKSGLAARCSRR